MSRGVVCMVVVALLSLWTVSGVVRSSVDESGEWLEAKAPLVNLEVYYETLCPDSRNFINTQLFPTANQVGHIVNITVYPYGKANETKNATNGHWEFKCQHGPKECATNLLTTCALHEFSKHQTHRHRLSKQLLDFIHCIENNSHPESHKVHRHCAEKQHFDWHKLKHCVDSRQGNQLEHRMALKTQALNPALNWVPWIVLNGVHNGTIQGEAVSNLIKLVCDTYTGERPKHCPPKL